MITINQKQIKKISRIAIQAVIFISILLCIFLLQSHTTYAQGDSCCVWYDVPANINGSTGVHCEYMSDSAEDRLSCYDGGGVFFPKKGCDQIRDCIVYQQQSGGVFHYLGLAGWSGGYANLGPEANKMIIADTIRVILSFVGIVFFILVIYGGFLWMTAGGNEEQVGKAKKILTNATVGLAVIMLSGLISYYISYLIEKGAAPPS